MSGFELLLRCEKWPQDVIHDQDMRHGKDVSPNQEVSNNQDMSHCLDKVANGQTTQPLDCLPSTVYSSALI